MASRPRVVLNRKAVLSWLNQVSPPVLEKVANAIAGRITGVPVSVTLRKNRQGRPVALITLTHAKGLASQAKHGTLTRAAAHEGVDVRRYPERLM